MKAVPAFGLGTYYKVGSPNAGTNASPMRGLVYLVKDNRDQPQANWLSHPEYQSGAPVLLEDAAVAQEYVASIIAARMPALRMAFGFGNDEVCLVPIPSSKVTAANLGGRWGPCGLARALERHGVGRLVVSLVHRQALPPSHSGQKPSADELARNLATLKRPPRGAPVLLVDDLITWGFHVAAADAVLGAERSAAVCVAFTDSATGLDCYQSRKRVVRYDTAVQGWNVSVLNS